MRTGGRLIERYVAATVLPYVLLALILLTAVLFAQQSTRMAELLLAARVTLALVGEVALALLPNVLIFTIPMATLTGVIIGLSQMAGDSELIALRASGSGTFKIGYPILILGFMLSCVTFYINFKTTPAAAALLRRAIIRAAVAKLDSPIEPRSFNTDIPGYVVYVRDANREEGTWGRVFIYAQGAGGATQLVTARAGRLDTSGDQSELVLTDAMRVQLPQETPQGSGSEQYIVERLGNLRFQFSTGRNEALERLQKQELMPDEMGWRALLAYSRTAPEAGDRLDAKVLLHRKLTLSLAPLLFALLGTGAGVQIKRGGRGAGALLALSLMLGYYIFSLIGEQLARAGTLRLYMGAWLASALAAAAALFLIILTRFQLPTRFRRLVRQDAAPLAEDFGIKSRTLELKAGRGAATSVRLLHFPSLLDAKILRPLALNFAAALAALIAIFLIFTLFELWRQIAANGVGAQVVANYLLFLLPFVSVQLIPASVLIAVLFTYALMAKRSEVVAWWGCGQSIYRLMVPAVVFAAAIGASLWTVQERIMPGANIRQDALRARIRRGEPRAMTSTGREWLASAATGRLYAYDYDEGAGGVLKSPAIYEFDDEGIHLRRVLLARQAAWTAPTALTLSAAETLQVSPPPLLARARQEQLTLAGVERPEVFKPGVDRPSQLSASALSKYIRTLKQRGESASALILALHRRYAAPWAVFVMLLLGLPLALSFGRRGAMTALTFAICVAAAFWAVSSGFEQLGNRALLSPVVAAWSPTMIFAALGIYLLARAGT